MFETQRMSQNYILLDFLADRDLYNYGRPLDLEREMSEENLITGRTLVDEVLEPLTVQYGPASVAGGFWPEKVRTSRGHYATSPHRWDYEFGAAVDVAFHNHVNNNDSPVKLLHMIDRSGMVFNRLISYYGSEFVCLCYREGNNRSLFYEEVCRPGQSRIQKRHGKNSESRRRSFPISNPTDWRREEGEGVGINRRFRAQHVRVGRYFVLLDFCRSVDGLRKGICTVPLVRFDKWDCRQVPVARMFSEILDPVQEEYRRLSVIRGMEPGGMSEDKHASKHRWLRGKGGHHRLEFLMSAEEECDSVRQMLEGTEHVVSVEMKQWGDGKSVHFSMEIEEFEPSVIWTSAAK